jgi:hypothetical protein
MNWHSRFKVSLGSIFLSAFARTGNGGGMVEFFVNPELFSPTRNQKLATRRRNRLVISAFLNKIIFLDWIGSHSNH